LFDLIIALGGGAAGAYAAISPRLSVAFVGVAIATALVPPLATCGIFLARGDVAFAGEALLLAGANIVAIQFAASAIFFLCGFRKITNKDNRHRGVLVGHAVSGTVLLLLTCMLTAALHRLVAAEIYKSAARQVLKSDLRHYPGAYLANVRFSRAGDRMLVRALVRGPKAFSAQEVGKLQSDLPVLRAPLHSELRVRFVPTTIMTVNGPLFSLEDTAAEESVDRNLE
jgi:uncharacterized membrane protein